MRALIVDDEPNIRATLRLTLQAAGHLVHEASTGPEALRLDLGQVFDVALIDVRLGQGSGLDLLEPLLSRSPRLAIVVITAHASIDTAIDAIRRGAFDYLPKPFTPALVRATLDRVARTRGLEDRVADLEGRVRAEVPEADLESPDPGVRRTLDLARRVAASDATVLIRGESGTGKGLLSRAIHAWSRRGSGPFVTVNCPGLNAELLESELFGHVRGSFTGAVRDSSGKVAAAEGGTLFLDELGDLPGPLQPKLLRFLQERAYERVGDPQTRSADVRLVAATNRDLESAVASGTFREDLLYRLNVVELTLPPLRLRSDVLGLADRLLAFFARQLGRSLDGFTAEARDALARHPWPGNLRELRNSVERAAILAPGPDVGLADLPERVAGAPADDASAAEGVPTLEQLEAGHIRRVLATSPSLEAAAKALGIDPSTLFRKRRRYGL